MGLPLPCVEAATLEDDTTTVQSEVDSSPIKDANPEAKAPRTARDTLSGPQMEGGCCSLSMFAVVSEALEVELTELRTSAGIGATKERETGGEVETSACWSCVWC